MIEQSYSGMENNPDASLVAEVENSDADLTADANKPMKKMMT